MPNTSLFGVDPINGRSKWNILDHTGPTSYATGGETFGQSVYGGPNIFGLSGFQAVIPCGESISGNYNVVANYGGTGVRSSIKLKWKYSSSAGQGVVAVTQGTAGSGMTAGTYPLTFGSGAAAGTITVTATAITNVTITNPGVYASGVAPTVSAATGGTPPVLVAVLGSLNGTEVPAGTNLSGETVRLLPIGG
jgi:hypothetical protein